MPKTETFSREKILEKVIQLFHKKGYNATSMQDLVDTTGLNRSSIYNSFGSKMELYEESLKTYKTLASKSVQKILIDTTDSLEAIRKIFTLSNVCVQGCLLSNCTTEMAYQDKKIKQFLIHNKEEMQELFEVLITKGQEEGSINTKKTAKEYAMFLFAALQGYKVTSIILNKPKDLESIVNTTLSVLK